MRSCSVLLAPYKMVAFARGNLQAATRSTEKVAMPNVTGTFDVDA